MLSMSSPRLSSLSPKKSYKKRFCRQVQDCFTPKLFLFDSLGDKPTPTLRIILTALTKELEFCID